MLKALYNKIKSYLLSKNIQSAVYYPEVWGIFQFWQRRVIQINYGIDIRIRTQSVYASGHYGILITKW